MTRFTSVAIAALFATSAWARTEVHSVEVDADLAVIENLEAAKGWQSLSDDLKTEIAERFFQKLMTKALRLKSRSTRYSLQTALPKRSVFLTANWSGMLRSTHRVFLIKRTTRSLRAPSRPLPTSQTAHRLPIAPWYYSAMLDAFADNVVSKLDE